MHAQLEAHFRTPLAFCANEFGYDKLDELKSYIFELAEKQTKNIDSEVAASLKHNLMESNFKLFNDERFSELKDYITQRLITVVKQVNDINDDNLSTHSLELVCDIVDSWYHVTEFGGYHETHAHGNCSWCGIIYIDTGLPSGDYSSGVNSFINPLKSTYIDAGNLFLDQDSRMTVNPEKGLMVLFPSYLDHNASPYYGDSKRVAIAFNAKFSLIKKV